MSIVSILIRPSRRMQRLGPTSIPAPSICFNPHPAFSPDATAGGRNGDRPSAAVSILIRPSRRMQPVALEYIATAADVSILIRPSRRMQPVYLAGQPFRAYLVSILIRPSRRMQPKSGCSDRPSQGVSILIRPSRRMQLHLDGSKAIALVVSILIRPSRRMQQASPTDITVPNWRFQSSSGLLAGCNYGRAGEDQPVGGVSILIRPSRRMQPGTGRPGM